MPLDLKRLREDLQALYRGEHDRMGERGTLERLEQARQWDLAPTLRAGGVLVFPHAGVLDCGHQIAAVVHACLDSGAGRVLVVSVLHAFTDEMETARRAVAAGEAPDRWPFWGIQGPGLPGREEWRDDHALMSFRHFLAAETRRRGIPGPLVVERYPYLAAGRPERLPGIDDLAHLAEDAVIVSTADAFHHGLGYGDPPERSYDPHAGGLELAQRTIETGMGILGRGDYWGYNQHCVQAKSDARDAGQVFRYLRGPMQGRIRDMTYSDASDLYRQPKPTWVAAALMEWSPSTLRGRTSIRMAELHDAALLAQLGAATFAQTFAAENTPEDLATYLAAAFSPAMLTAELQARESSFLIVSVDGRPAGYARLSPSAPPEGSAGARPVELVRFYVDQAWHGRGVSHVLMESVVSHAAERSYTGMWLGVWERNTRAGGFYRKWGFEVAGRKTFQLGSDLQTDLVMTRQLPPQASH